MSFSPPPHTCNLLPALKRVANEPTECDPALFLTQDQQFSRLFHFNIDCVNRPGDWFAQQGCQGKSSNLRRPPLLFCFMVASLRLLYCHLYVY